MKGTFLPVYEILHLSGLTPRLLVDLLARGLVTFKQGVAGELLIELDSITPELLARHGLSGEGAGEDRSNEVLIEELVASTVLKRMGTIVEESFLMARQWLPSAALPPDGPAGPDEEAE